MLQRLRQGATLVQHLQREVQAYELGPGMCHNVKASQGLLRFQLILCGPCQMIRSEDALKDKFLDAFFSMINKDPVSLATATEKARMARALLQPCLTDTPVRA